MARHKCGSRRKKQTRVDVRQLGLTTLEKVRMPKTTFYLWCDNNQLTELILTKRLVHLTCSHNKLEFLPKLPKTLLYLECCFNQLTKLPKLPSSLLSIRCNRNKLFILPKLPPKLDQLDVSRNCLTQVPILPPTLTWLILSGNKISKLSSLPVTLLRLDISGNEIEFVPSLKDLVNLYEFCCSSNPLTTLPALPEGLKILDIGNTKISHLPNLPQSLFILRYFDTPFHAKIARYGCFTYRSGILQLKNVLCKFALEDWDRGIRLVRIVLFKSRLKLLVKLWKR